MIRLVLFAVYIVFSGYSLVSHAAVQKAPEVTFFSDYISRFHYQSHTNVATRINLTLSAQVGVQVIEETENTQKLLFTISNVKNGLDDGHERGEIENPYQNLNHGWFAVLRDYYGQISAVYYDADDFTHNSVNVKKTIASMISMYVLPHEPEYDHEDTDPSGSYLAHYMRSNDGTSLIYHTNGTVTDQNLVKHLYKVIKFGQDGNLESVTMTEDVEGSNIGDERNGFFALSVVYSKTMLKYVDRRPSNSIPNAPQHIVTDTLELVHPVIHTQLTQDIKEEIEHTILSCVKISDKKCIGELKLLFQDISSSELKQFVEEYISTNTDSPEQLVVLLQALCTSQRKDLGFVIPDDVLSELSTDVMHHFLPCLSASKPTSGTLNMLHNLAFDRNERSTSDTDLSNTAILLLGTVAKKMEATDPGASNKIVERLHLELSKHANVKRREISDADHQFRLAVIVDSIGNAGADRSLDTITAHINARHPLTVQHSALRALRHYKNEKSAKILLETALDGNLHHSLRHVAAHSYHQHPLRERDLTDIIKETSRHLSRHTRAVATTPGLTENVYNVSVPGIGWSRRFGGENISTELNNRQINDYIISTDPFSTSYEFSLHSATWVDTFLELSDAPKQFELISTSLCYEGRVQYDANMLQNYQRNLSQQRYDLFNPLSAGLADGIQNSVDALIISEANYDGIFDSLHAALSSMPTKLNAISSLLSDYRAIVDSIPANNSYRQSADDLYSIINEIYTEANAQTMAAIEPISAAINVTLPDGPARVTAAAREVQAAALLFSPRQTLNDIFSEHARIMAAVSSLRERVNSLRVMVDPSSVDAVWANPPPALDRVSTNINRLASEIDEQLQYEVTADVTDYRVVRRALLNQLLPAVTSLEELGDDLLAAVDSLYTAFQQTSQHLDTLTNNYEHAWFEVDSIFGQRFDQTFPDRLRSCDVMCGCGNYPSTTNGLYLEGIDLITTNGQQIFAPFAGIIRLINSSDPFEANMHDVDETVVLLLNDFNYQDLIIIITNVNPAAFIGVDGVQVYTGQLIGVTNSDVLCDSRPFIHVEMYKQLNGSVHVIDPSQFLPVNFQPDVSMELQCNDVTVMQSGMVVAKQRIAGQDPTLQLMDPPIVEVARNEFPQLRDYTLSDNYSYTSAEETELFRDSTFLLVGPFPIEFSFSATGRYDVEVSIEAGFLSKALRSTVVQSSTASVQGYMRVGNALYAEVAVEGKLLESSVQGFMEQQWEEWPLSAKSSMNLKLSPSILNLTTGLTRQTGAGAFANLEVLDSQILWQYSVPPLQVEEYIYRGLTEDETAPSFTQLSYDDSTFTPSCFVRQLPYRLYYQPAFEVEVDLQDCEDNINTTLRVGTHLDGDDVFQTHVFSGQRIVAPHSLDTGKRLFATVEAVNSMGLQSLARCQLFAYDTSPPMGRINPRSLFSSHPSQLESLIVLFDEYGLIDVYEVAIATSPGNYNNVMEWQEFSTSLIDTPPSLPASNLSLFSAPRPGQLAGNIIEVVFDVIIDDEDCALTCLDEMLCKSFDFSVDDSTCVLHSDIEGPVTDAAADYPNNFATPLLRASASFYHYEKLGIGNSTNHIFTDLALESGWTYYINVRLQNRLGYSNIVSSPGIFVDFTPPEPGVIANAVRDNVVSDDCDASIIQQCVGPTTNQPNHRIIIDGSGSAAVFNGPTPLLDALYTGANHFIAVNWDGFRDDESGIYGYTWCVGNITGSCNVLDYQAAPPLLQSSQAWTNIGLFDMSNQILPDGPYYLSVQAVNNAAYGGSLVTTVHHSTPYVVDTTTPLLQITMVDPYDTVANTLTVYYMASDDGSGISDVAIALGYTQHDVNLFQWTSVNTSGTAVVGVYLPNRINAYVKVRATNNVGLTTIATWPSSIIVDREQPTVGVVLDGDRPTQDVDYQSDKTQLCVTFTGFHGAVSYSWAAGTTPGDSNTIAFRNLTSSESENKRACMDGLNLQDNTVYYSTITARNIVGLTQTVSSDGVLIDSTPPNIGVVYDGLSPGIDLEFSSDAFTAQAHWINFTDDESSVSHYVILVFYRAMDSEYTLAYTKQLSNWTQEVTLDRFTFDTGYRVLLQLEAYNLAGLVTAVNTTGVTIDLTAPMVTSLNDIPRPTTSGEDVNYQNVNNSYNMNWNASDPESNIVRVEVALFEVSEGRRVLVYPNATSGYEMLPDTMLTPAVHVWTVEGLDLTSGRTYIGSLLFTNGAGLQLRAETNGIVVDTNPPELQSVRVVGTIGGPNEDTVNITATDVIEGRWEATDRESNLIQYRAGIMNTLGVYITPNEAELVDFGYSRGGILSDLTLVIGNSYRLEVLAIDQSGLASSQMTSFTVIEGDTAGNVRDGENPTDDIDYTDETTAITAHFDGFNGRSCGGIVRYEWAVGIDGIGQEEVFPFTEKGIIFESDGSGKAQCSVPGLEQYGRQILYTTVRAITGCGGILESSSDGFVIDSSPPEVAFIAVGANAIELGTASKTGDVVYEHQPYQTEQLVSAVWTATDAESNIQTERVVKMGSYPGGSDVIAETTVTDDFVRGLEMTANAGEPHYVTVSIWNRAGVRQDVTAPSVTWDQTPPRQGEILCDTFAPANWTFPSLMVESSITCIWSGFYDIESGIDYYSIMIGTVPGEGNLHTAFVISESNSYSSPVLQFELMLEYYVTFRVSNRAGIQANIVQGPIVVATNIPKATGSVTVVPNYEEYVYNGNSSEQVIPQDNAAQCLFASTILTIRWNPFKDERSGISKYQISVGFSPGSDEVYSFQDARPLLTSTGSLSYDLSPVYFPPRSTAPVYVSVRGFNNAGYHTTISSNEIYIISDENTDAGWVNDGGEAQMDIEYQVSTNRIAGTFSTGVNCPLASIQWAVEAADGMRALNFTASSISDGTAFNGSYFLSSNALSLYNGETYRIIVQVVDQTGRPYLLRSDGVTVTTKPLFPGFVQDGPVFTHDLNYQESLTTLSGHWSNFGDGTPEQEVAYYEVALGSDREFPNTRTSIVPFTNVGTNTSFTFMELDLVPLTQQYFITVRAHAVSGAYVDATSNGIIAGLGGTIIPGNIFVTPYQSDATSVAVYWTKFESDFPIRLYSWALGSEKYSSEELGTFCADRGFDYTESFSVFGFFNVGSNTEATADNLNLTHGMSYYVTVRAIDDAKKCIAHQASVPIVVDVTDPVGGKIYVGPSQSRINVSDDEPYITYIVEGRDIEAYWSGFVDDESGIDRYEIALILDNECSNTTAVNDSISYINVLTEVSYMFEGVTLDSVANIQVISYNKAGLYTIIDSQPILPDGYQPVAGIVKDGVDWGGDLTFQSDLTSLSAVFSHSKLRPDELTDDPCPMALNFSLDSENPDWSIIQPLRLVGLDDSRLDHQNDRVGFSTDPNMPGTIITATGDSQRDRIITGAYQTDNILLYSGGRVSMDIRAALESSPVSRELRENIVTSVVFIDSLTDQVIVEYDREDLDSGTVINFKAVGLQIHQPYINSTSNIAIPARLVLWSKQSTTLASPRYASVDTHIDLTQEHHYEFRFTSKQPDTYTVDSVVLYVDGVKMAILEGIPQLSDNTRMLLHLFNRMSYTPSLVDPSDIPLVEAVYSEVRLPVCSTSICQHGTPFYNWGSPVVEFQVGIGSSAGVVDIQEFQTLLYPCKPCVPGPCVEYACQPSCSNVDPYLVPVTLSNLTLTPGYYVNQSDDISISPFNNGLTLSSFFTNHYQPAVYYVAIKAITASGQEVIGTSNGVTIDITPPQLVGSIEHFDVEFSLTQPTEYQGNNHTITAKWLFVDLESGIINYDWAIGSYPGANDVQDYVSVGLATTASNSNLEGNLTHNTTYYITVRATNGAYLVKEIISSGITYIATELNSTALELIVMVSHIEVFEFQAVNSSSIGPIVLRTDRTDTAAVSWNGVSPDVSQIFWRIGTERGGDDVFPPTEVSFGRAQSARINQRMLDLDDMPFAGLAEIFSLAAGANDDFIDDLMAVEPGRIHYHTIQFCSFAHRCVDVVTDPVVVIRSKDTFRVSGIGEDITLTINQFRTRGDIIAVVDRTYDVVIKTTNGVNLNGTLMAGFLNSTNLRLSYRASVPYISNPFVTMARTSVEVARRFTTFGGPSFYISFLGMETLLGPLSVNMTFDRTLDWSHSIPELLYWDIGNQLWRAVADTCASTLRIDWPTFTIATEICNTVVEDEFVSSGSGERNDMMGRQPSQRGYLERPIQLVVAQIGNASINTPPSLVIPELPLQVDEGNVLVYQVEYIDDENDIVDFYLTSLPKYGHANITASGLLTYIPCTNCTGLDTIGIYILERPFGVNIRMEASGTLQIQISNINDPPEIFFADVDDKSIYENTTMQTYIDANRTDFVSVAQIGAWDLDGSEDDLSVSIIQPTYGQAQAVVWLDVVTTTESLPVNWSQIPSSSGAQYNGQVAFIGVNITYLPDNPSEADYIDQFVVFVRDTGRLTSTVLTIQVEVLYSSCQNNGVCNGSIDDPDCSNATARRDGFDGYTCACPNGFTGIYCENQTEVIVPTAPTRLCPAGIPMVQCDGNPCDGATCPSHPAANCTPNYCGSCRPQWTINDNEVQCHANSSAFCSKPVNTSQSVVIGCADAVCDCPEQKIFCPTDSILVETRINDCCVQYECRCPNISCPLLMERGVGVQPVPVFRGNKFPGRCCPNYDYQDIDECEERNGLCSGVCVNEDYDHQCVCQGGTTLAQDGFSCGVCYLNGQEYLFGDRVKVGCNWCQCMGDDASSERWQCTLQSCEPTCLYNGDFYPINSIINQGPNSCGCIPTDVAATWDCLLGVSTN